MSRFLFVVCFFLCSAAAMHGQQSSFSESVYGVHNGSSAGNCVDESSTVLDIFCSASWVDGVAEGYEEAGVKNSFGIMTAAVLAEVICSENECSDEDEAGGLLSVHDSLSIFGLTNEPTAFLKVAIACPGCPQYKGLPGSAVYQLTALWENGTHSASCTTQVSPRCTLTIPILYGVNGTPLIVQIVRGLSVGTITNVKGGVAGARIVTWVEIDAADVGAAVVDANGRIIVGVTVVGASGHIYN